MGRPRTIFKIGKNGYKENEFGEGEVQSKRTNTKDKSRESPEEKI